MLVDTKLVTVGHSCLIPSSQDSKDVSFRQVTLIACFLLLTPLSKTMTASRPGFTADIVSLEERLHLEDYLARRMGK